MTTKIRFLPLGRQRPMSRAERERQVSMRLHRGAPPDFQPDAAARAEMSRMSGGPNLRAAPVTAPAPGGGLKRASATRQEREGSSVEMAGRQSARHLSRAGK